MESTMAGNHFDRTCHGRSMQCRSRSRVYCFRDRSCYRHLVPQASNLTCDFATAKGLTRSPGTAQERKVRAGRPPRCSNVEWVSNSPKSAEVSACSGTIITLESGPLLVPDIHVTIRRAGVGRGALYESDLEEHKKLVMPVLPNRVSPVTETVADPQRALEHFERLLSFETDCWDVHAAIRTGHSDFVLLDVRSPQAYAAKHVPTAINLPHGRINEHNLAQFPPATLFVVYCAGPHCNGADRGAVRLARLGRKVKKMIGGIEGWRDEGFSFETGEPKH
jgi:rhodanese-related sulfurtransferase